MRTTLTIDDVVSKQLKAQAARQGGTLASLVNDMLRQALAKQEPRPPYKLDWDAQLRPGVDILDRDKLFDLMQSR
jgi:plasmid stability protein